VESEGLLTFAIIKTIPFSSETKRMGIVVELEGKQYFFLKGADSVMRRKVHESHRAFVDEECENLAREGLRTLVLAYGEEDRNMQLLCVTGI
jgi:phospholipid-translocating ATPase